MSYSYLASPYSHRDPRIVQARYDAAEKATAWLLKNRIWVYSPIVHCHALAVKFNLPTDAHYWNAYNEAMLRPADEVLVLAIEGWKESKGVTTERCAATLLNKPIHLMKPNGDGYEVNK